jgi:hypothetical protein
MTTHCNIGVENDGGTITFVYCHYDGYPKGVGAGLLERYNDDESVRVLVAGGDISSLGGHVSSPGRGIVRREQVVAAPRTITIGEDLRSFLAEEYTYLFVRRFGLRREPHWLVKHQSGIWEPLDEALMRGRGEAPPEQELEPEQARALLVQLAGVEELLG